MDKKNKLRFDKTEEVEAKYMRQVQNEYSVRYSNIRRVILEFIDRYGIDGKLTNDAYKYSRWDNLIKSVYNQLSGLKTADINQFERYFKNQYQYNYLNTGFILESNYQNKLNFSELPGKKIPTINTMSKVALEVDADAVRGNLQRALSQSIAQGEGIGKSSERIKAALEKNMNNALRITRTETTRAMNEANLKGMEKAASKLSIQKEWVATLDGRTRRTHGRADGQRVDIDKPFKVGNDKLMFPGDPTGSAKEVINCRCTMREIVEGYSNSAQYRRAKGLDGKNEVIPYKTYEEWANERLT